MISLSIYVTQNPSEGPSECESALYEYQVAIEDGWYAMTLPWWPGAAVRLQNNVRLAAIQQHHLDKRLA